MSTRPQPFPVFPHNDQDLVHAFYMHISTWFILKIILYKSLWSFISLCIFRNFPGGKEHHNIHPLPKSHQKFWKYTIKDPIIATFFMFTIPIFNF